MSSLFAISSPLVEWTFSELVCVRRLRRPRLPGMAANTALEIKIMNYG